jgi:hypothetical protein
VKNRDSLSTNADSLQRSAIAFATIMVYNMCVNSSRYKLQIRIDRQPWYDLNFWVARMLITFSFWADMFSMPSAIAGALAAHKTMADE